MKKIALILPPQHFQFKEVSLKDIKKNIKIIVLKKFREIFKKNFIWKKSYIKKKFNKYEINTIVLISIILSKNKNSKYTLFGGVSIGEFLSLYFANILSLNETIDLVLRRAKILYDENKKNPGFMLSIYGAPSNLKKIINTPKFKNNVKISIIYSKFFYNISVRKNVYKNFKNILKKKKINFSILQGTGAWHSSLILNSKNKIKKLINNYNYKFKDCLLSNFTGYKHKNKSNLKNNLISQTFNVIRWDKNIKFIKKNCFNYESPFKIKTIQKIIYLTKSNI